eukprot:7394268-Alexandrium_andersonii.AAC.1
MHARKHALTHPPTQTQNAQSGAWVHVYSRRHRRVHRHARPLTVSSRLQRAAVVHACRRLAARCSIRVIFVFACSSIPVSYTHLRAHETSAHL